MRLILAAAIVGLAYSAAHAQHTSVDSGIAGARAVELNGTTITYVERGAGAPLLLVHGAFADLRYWQTVMEPLAESHRVVAYSRRDFYPNPFDDAPSSNRSADREVQGASHNVHLDNPGELTRALRAFIGRH
jgi:pimeloyl-ACP methyl ester carboxylesterase